MHGEVKTPPFSAAVRVEAGTLLRRLQRGESFGLPHARPMSSVGARCGELRVVDEKNTWRIVCRADTDAIIIAEVFAKKTAQTPKHVIATCKRRLRLYDQAVEEK